jgi:hypothetical protein
MSTLNLTRDGIIAALRPVNPDAAFLSACAAMDANLVLAEQVGVVRRSKERRARRKRVRLYRDPASHAAMLRWLSLPMFGGTFASVDVAVRALRRRLAVVRLDRERGIMSESRAFARELRERLTVAVYFARHGEAFWQREAA